MAKEDKDEKSQEEKKSGKWGDFGDDFDLNEKSDETGEEISNEPDPRVSLEGVEETEKTEKEISKESKVSFANKTAGDSVKIPCYLDGIDGGNFMELFMYGMTQLKTTKLSNSQVMIAAMNCASTNKKFLNELQKQIDKDGRRTANKKR